jgi:hypothetical protein
MKAKIVVVAMVGILAAGCATVVPSESAGPKPGRYALADNGTLVVDADGRMRMFDIYGQPVYMKDGEPMRLKDNTVVVMKENVIWKALRTKGTPGPRGV